MITLVVNCEIYKQCFCFCGIIIHFFFHETIDVGIIYSEDKSILGPQFKVDPHFREGREATESNGKGKERVLGVVSLSCGDDVFSY